jgi:hypothetical protein
MRKRRTEEVAGRERCRLWNGNGPTVGVAKAAGLLSERRSGSHEEYDGRKHCEMMSCQCEGSVLFIYPERYPGDVPLRDIACSVLMSLQRRCKPHHTTSRGVHSSAMNPGIDALRFVQKRSVEKIINRECACTAVRWSDTIRKS